MTEGKLTRVLIVEDNDSDADLMEAELRRSGLDFNVQRVMTEETFVKALHDFAPDVVLSDHSLPTFGAKDAVRIAQRERPGTPVLVVTGRLDDETAVEYLKAGAIDYVLKQKMIRLGSAVRRALDLKRAKEEHAAAEEARKVLEQQLYQSQKMESIGRLAGSVAHDFNNLLTVILGEAELAMRATPADGSVAESLEQIRKAGHQATELTRQLLMFSRRKTVEPKVMSVEELVRDVEKMLRRLIGEDVELRCRLSAQPGAVNADPGLLHQVLLNLAVNARDAMPQGGTLTIETDRVTLDESDERIGANITPGDYVSIAVSDTGTGMTPEVMARVLEPFFTTKEVGKGTGIGLSTSYGIIKKSGGHLTMESEIGVGTIMRVYLPAVLAS